MLMTTGVAGGVDDDGDDCDGDGVDDGHWYNDEHDDDGGC